METHFRGEIVLITGGGMGVGRAISQRLAAKGATVIVNDIDADRCESVVSEINRNGGDAHPLVCDVTLLERMRAGVSDVTKNTGPVTILVNNAGVVPERRTGEIGRPLFVEMADKYWKKIVDLNFYGVMNCVSIVAPAMMSRRKGKIISIVSEAARVGEPRMAVYSGAKAAVIGFSRAIARELGPYCVNVNMVALSAVSHENPIAGFQKMGATIETDETLRKVLRNYPIGEGLGRLTTPNDAADAVLFLASEQAAYVTGQCLGVNGGFTMR